MLHLMAETIAGMFWRKSRVKGRKFTVDFIMIAGVFCTCCRWQTCTVVRSRLSTRWRRKRMLMMMMTWTDSNWCRLITSSGANRSIRRRRLSEMSHTMWYFVSLLHTVIIIITRSHSSPAWWRWWWQLDYWSYKSCKAPVNQRTNIQFFTGRMPFLSPNQQCQSTAILLLYVKSAGSNTYIYSTLILDLDISLLKQCELLPQVYICLVDLLLLGVAKAVQSLAISYTPTVICCFLSSRWENLCIYVHSFIVIPITLQFYC